MLAKDVMTTEVVSVRPETNVTDIARTLLERHISAVPVVDDTGKIRGIVSEGDLMRRSESGTEARGSWWLALLASPEDVSRQFVKTHGRHARDVMTREVVTADENTPLERLASLLERRHIKRVPIVRDGVLAGIVSRADLLRGLATSKSATVMDEDDSSLRQAVETAIREQTGVSIAFIGVTVGDGVAHLWGGVEDLAHKDAARVAAENVPGIRSVEDKLVVFPPNVRAALWAD